MQPALGRTGLEKLENRPVGQLEGIAYGQELQISMQGVMLILA